jgi:hypothetical protein
MPGEPDAHYVAARRALLDVLEALGEHRQSVVLVGAQAIYLITGEGDLAAAPFTTDADLALDPARLRPDPPLEAALGSAGFTPARGKVGTWTSRTGIDVDLLVPEQEAVSRDVTEQALRLLAKLFATPEATGSQMAVRATLGLEEPETIAASCALLASELLNAVQ